MDDQRLKDITLAEIENILRINGRSLRDFPPMPLPNDALMSNLQNMLISEELNYDKELLRSQHSTLLSTLTLEQKNIYNLVMDAVSHEHGGVFFVNGFGVASSGIASQLIQGGRTTHSRFAIPLQCNENSTCNIMQGSDLANLLIHTKLIIWDEAPMSHRFFFEALDRTLRDICGNNNPDCYTKLFGGKVVVFGGDFRQILPVIPRGSHQDTVLSSLNSSYIWDSCKVLTLTKNMRLGTSNTDLENQDIVEFADWILKIGDGEVGEVLNDEEKEITIPTDLLITNVVDPIQSIVESTYPFFADNYRNYDFIRERAILAPMLDDVSSINDYMLSLLPGEEITYLSSDSISNQDPDSELANMYTTEFLNIISGSGLPYHQLRLKFGAPIMLLRNIDKSMGLCNGTRLIVASLCKHVIEATIISGKFTGERVIVARMVISPSDSRLPFKFTGERVIVARMVISPSDSRLPFKF
ncbi:helicase-like protein [Senna tora]|uniref:ATP-dependent DNA helicase n=1 Tax=Senna tora TaxID=362788 RepID=A0A834T1E5_9FABA|nr:helicase-like protein [Senna tora]